MNNDQTIAITPAPNGDQTIAIPVNEYKKLVSDQTELNFVGLLARGLASYQFYEALEAIGWMTYDKLHRPLCPESPEKEV